MKHWLFFIFFIGSLHTMEDWDSDAEKETPPSEKGIASLEINDVTSFYEDPSLLKKIKKKSVEIKKIDNDNVNGVILVPKEGKILTDITRLCDFRNKTNQLKLKNWEVNSSINGVLVYFTKEQNFDEVSKKFKNIWGIKEICTLNRMEELFKNANQESIKTIISPHGSPSNRND